MESADMRPISEADAVESLKEMVAVSRLLLSIIALQPHQNVAMSGTGEPFIGSDLHKLLACKIEKQEKLLGLP